MTAGITSAMCNACHIAQPKISTILLAGIPAGIDLSAGI